MRRRAVGTVIAFLVASCAEPSASPRPDASGAAPSVAVGEHLFDDVPPTDSPPPTQRRSEASFAMRLSDANDMHPSGVRVQMTGPVTRTITSDAGGYVKGSVPPGIYRFKVVEGCHGTVLVTKGGSGQAGVVEGRTTTGTLLLLWQHRYGPAPPVYTDYGEEWPVGRPITFSFAIEDRCGTEPTPRASIATFAFRTSTNLEVVGEPTLRAGPDGRTKVSVACTEESDVVRLDVYDRVNPDDTMDLIQQAIGYQGFVHCSD